MGSLDGQVAVITGGGRGQGRSHAVHLARAGASIVVCDVASDPGTARYESSTPEDLAETVRLVEAEDQRCVAVHADVRDHAQMATVADAAIAEFGKIDVLLANAGVMRMNPIQLMAPSDWRDVIDTNLSGVFNAMHVCIPHMIANGYGRIVATASTMARGAAGNCSAYTASKWGVVGLVKAVAQDVAMHNITVNAVAPTAVGTRMIFNDDLLGFFRPDLESPSPEDAREAMKSLNVLPVAWLEPSDISRSILFLLSDDAKYMTGAVLDINAGHSARVPT